MREDTISGTMCLTVLFGWACGITLDTAKQYASAVESKPVYCLNKSVLRHVRFHSADHDIGLDETRLSFKVKCAAVSMHEGASGSGQLQTLQFVSPVFSLDIAVDESYCKSAYTSDESLTSSYEPSSAVTVPSDRGCGG